MGDLDDEDGKLHTVELTAREVRLLLKYGGCPFPYQEQTLRESKAVKGYHRVSIDVYWIEMMIADLVRSAQEIRSRTLLEELDELCSTLEHALIDPGQLRFVSFE